MVKHISDNLWDDSRNNKLFKINGETYYIQYIDYSYGHNKTINVTFIQIPDTEKEEMWQKMIRGEDME